MKFDDIRACDLCKKPVAGKTRTGNSLDFYRLVVEKNLLNLGAINERIGLTMMMGGSEQLAGALASHDKVAIPFDRRELLICFGCMTERRLSALFEDGENTVGKELPITAEEQRT